MVMKSLDSFESGLFLPPDKRVVNKWKTEYNTYVKFGLILIFIEEVEDLA